MKEKHIPKKYKAVFFDWDGTAVRSRKAPADLAVEAMRPLLDQGIKLAIVSGTTMDKIMGGQIAQSFTPVQLDNLYLGLGRGALNYAFRNGQPYLFSDLLPDAEMLETIHRICFDIHLELKRKYDFDTDIVFTRPNYCKIDLMVHSDRGDKLFLQAQEVDALKDSLQSHGISGGLQGLLDLAVQTGKKYGVDVKPTCDAKYLEVGISSKSDNVHAILAKITADGNIEPAQCAYWGDEFVGIEPGIFGSDSFMYIPETAAGDFYDVSDVAGERPAWVKTVGGGVEQFLGFLREQAAVEMAEQTEAV
ncbi:MAG: HAD family hydrolase [Bilifractor sp.]